MKNEVLVDEDTGSSEDTPLQLLEPEVEPG